MWPLSHVPHPVPPLMRRLHLCLSRKGNWRMTCWLLLSFFFWSSPLPCCHVPPDAFDLSRFRTQRREGGCVCWGEGEGGCNSNSFNLQERLGVVSADGLSFWGKQLLGLKFLHNLNFDKVQNPWHFEDWLTSYPWTDLNRNIISISNFHIPGVVHPLSLPPAMFM